jgi:recombination protein RecT
MVPAIRPASTVMLLRADERATSFEVLMLRRSAKSVFAPDVFAFPGGAVDPADYSDRARARIQGLDRDRLARMFRARRAASLDDPALAELEDADRAALIVAAVRELFEEGGVLLGKPPDSSLDVARLNDARDTLWHGKSDFAEILWSHDLRLDASGLELFSVWVTPANETRRFHAHFFVARADRQLAAADRIETHDEIWIEPRAALCEYTAGRFAMVYPTIKHIERLAAFANIEEVLEFARTKPILRIMPNTTAERGFSLPADLENAW